MAKLRLSVTVADVGASVEAEPHETVRDVIHKALLCALGGAIPSPDSCELACGDEVLDPDKRLDETVVGDGAMLTLTLPF